MAKMEIAPQGRMAPTCGSLPSSARFPNPPPSDIGRPFKERVRKGDETADISVTMWI